MIGCASPDNSPCMKVAGTLPPITWCASAGTGASTAAQAANTLILLSKDRTVDLRRGGLGVPGPDAASDGDPFRDEIRRLMSLHMTIATPRAMSRITAFSTAGLLALGSQHPATFPVSQLCVGLQLTDYSCGGSRGFGISCLCRLMTPDRIPIQSPCGEPSPD